MHFTRATDLLLAGLIGLGAGYLVFQLASTEIPKLPIAAGGLLGVLAAVDAGLALWVRRMVAGRRLTQPVVVARCVVLAKASSMLGALMLGGWLGVFGYLYGRSSVVADEEVPSAVVGAVCAAALIAAGLWLEHSCRTPEQQDRDHSPDSAREP
ncbi:MAG: DUF3180 domain-containing protein [Thermocrispum sp.]